MLGQAARTVLARLIEADADEPDEFFVVVHVNGPEVMVKHGRRFREAVNKFGLSELEASGLLLANSRDQRGRLASFWVPAEAADQLEEASEEAGLPTPLAEARATIAGLEARIEAGAAARRTIARRVGRIAQIAAVLAIMALYTGAVILIQQTNVVALGLGIALLIGAVFDVAGVSGRSLSGGVRDFAERRAITFLDARLDPGGMSRKGDPEPS